jgi:hypothetical protein
VSAPAAPVRAEFRHVAGPQRDCVVVHFNPTTLKFQITNTQQQRQSENAGSEFVSESAGQLTLDLVFDTTGSGQDVRIDTKKLALFMKPEARVLPTLKFKWGDFEFEGTMASFQETIDYFAASGVPLRSTVSVTLKTKSKTFDYTTSAGQAQTDDAQLTLPPEDAPDDGRRRPSSTTGIAQQAGDPRQGRALAAANGIENMRFPGGGSLVVSAEVSLQPAVAFSAGASFDSRGSAGASFGAGAGVNFGASAGVSFGAGAGLTVSEGAFAGLRAGASNAGPPRRLQPQRLLADDGVNRVATSEGARFAVGGQAIFEGSASLTADVGRDVNLQDRLQFEEG